MSSSTGAVYDTTTRIATGATINIRTFGAQPKRVVITNLTNDVRADWNEAMTAGYAYVTAAAGTRSLVTSAGITLLAGSGSSPPGFSLGALAHINDTTTEELLFEVWY